MPIFEYVCRDCHHRFETLVHRHTRPTCPACHSEHLDKQLSVFAVASVSRHDASPAPAPCARCGDPRGPGACALA
jgi:putative FmdB family regulatory protein